MPIGTAVMVLETNSSKEIWTWSKLKLFQKLCYIITLAIWKPTKERRVIPTFIVKNILIGIINNKAIKCHNENMTFHPPSNRLKPVFQWEGSNMDLQKSRNRNLLSLSQYFPFLYCHNFWFSLSSFQKQQEK